MATSKVPRDVLVALVERIREARQSGVDDRHLLTDFVNYLPDSDVNNLCDSDYDVETIVDICMGKTEAKRMLAREELVDLVERIRNVPAKTEAEAILRVIAFKHNCRHPAGSDLLFFPDDVFGSGSPTTEEIVTAAIEGTEK
jgi:hypothetical protein